MPQILSWWEIEQWFLPADVAIVGGGLLGLWTAHALQAQAPHLRITILEKEAVPMGASTRNAGFACFGSPSELLCDARQLGKDGMLEVVDMRYRGIQKLRAVLGDEAIGFEPCGGFECYTQPPPDFQLSLVELNQWLQPVFNHAQAFSLATHRLPPLGLHGFDAMVENTLEGSIHSGKLVRALTQLVQQQGATLLYGARVTHWENMPNGCRLHTSRGSLQAAQMVLATNAWLPELAATVAVQPARGQVLVTKPIAKLALHGTFHFDEGFYYWRHLGNRILLGGARNVDMTAEATLDFNTTNTIQHALESFLCRHLPQHFTPHTLPQMIAHRWSGMMAMSTTKKPILQQLGPQVWAAMCCNGMGVALTPIFAEKVAAALLTT